MSDQSSFSRALFLAVDAWQYGRRDDRQQAELQVALTDAVHTAAQASGLDWASWHEQHAGDGFLAEITETGGEPKLVDPFIRELDVWLKRYNHDRVEHAHLRLRVAMHHGGATPGALGYSGAAPVHVSRLCDSAPARRALKSFPAARLALVVSEPIFEGLVSQRHTSLSAADFARVEVKMPDKAFTALAWLRVPGIGTDRLSAAINGDIEARDSDTFGVAVKVGPATPARAGRVQEIVAQSLSTTGLRPCDELGELGDDVFVHVSDGTPGARILGAWIRDLHRALDDRVPDARTVVAVALAPEPLAAAREARELAGSDDASAVLGSGINGPLAVVVTDRVYRSAVQRGGRFVLPETYRRTGADPTSWLRVPGRSVPPRPLAGPTASEAAESPDVRGNEVHAHGDGPAFGQATFHAPFVIGSFTQQEGPRR